MRRALACATLALVAALATTSPAAADVTAAGTLRLIPIGSFHAPTYVTSPPADASRLFVVEQGGAIRLVRDGAPLPGTFLTVPHVHDSGEQGLLSMAFAPDYAATGRFYVYYNDATSCDSTGQNCDVRVDEFRSADADHADPGSQRTVLTINHQAHPNNDGGQLQFGPDGQLYVGVGDGGGAYDSDSNTGNAQNTDVLLGKLLRIDPRSGLPYAIPADNPFSGAVPGRDEVWSYGLRNPWRFSFDHLTGDLLIGDVGQDRHEEVDYQAHGFGGGANYGWKLYEGFERVFNPKGPQPSDYVAPVFAYDDVNGACGIDGGYVARDRALPELEGRYLYGDHCQGQLRSIAITFGHASGDAAVGDPANPVAPPLTVGQLVSFGEDAACRLYAVSQAGPVYRLSSTQPGPNAGCALAPVAPPDRLRPVIGRLAMARSSFAVGGAPTALIGRRARPRVPRGSAFRFTLSEDALVFIRIERAVTGRRVGRRCLAATRARRRARPCTRYVHVATLRRQRQGGRRSVPFSGRIGRKPLAAGRYRAVLTARDASGNASRARSVAFTVVTG